MIQKSQSWEYIQRKLWIVFYKTIHMDRKLWLLQKAHAPLRVHCSAIHNSQDAEAS